MLNSAVIFRLNCQLNRTARKGSKIPASIPPTLIPDCLMPMAVALPSRVNQSMTALLEVGRVEPPAIPMKPKRINTTTKDEYWVTAKLRTPRNNTPRDRRIRTPIKSAQIPAGIIMMEYPAATALTKRPTCVEVKCKSRMKKGAKGPTQEYTNPQMEVPRHTKARMIHLYMEKTILEKFHRQNFKIALELLEETLEDPTLHDSSGRCAKKPNIREKEFQICQESQKSPFFPLFQRGKFKSFI